VVGRAGEVSRGHTLYSVPSARGAIHLDALSLWVGLHAVVGIPAMGPFVCPSLNYMSFMSVRLSTGICIRHRDGSVTGDLRGIKRLLPASAQYLA
jgi:hypothetical protein